jgi:hypothetical protein
MPVGTVAFAEKGSETFNFPFFELSDENEVVPKNMCVCD